MVKTCTSSAFTNTDFHINITLFSLLRPHTHPPHVPSSIRTPLISIVKLKIIETNDTPKGISYSSIRGADMNILRALGPFDLLYIVLMGYMIKNVIPEPYENIMLCLS